MGDGGLLGGGSFGRGCRGEGFVWGWGLLGGGGLLVAGNLRRFLISCLVFCVKILGWDNFWYVFGVFCCFFLRFPLFFYRFLLGNTLFWVSFTQKIVTLLYFLRKFPGTRKFPLIKLFCTASIYQHWSERDCRYKI